LNLYSVFKVYSCLEIKMFIFFVKFNLRVMIPGNCSISYIAIWMLKNLLSKDIQRFSPPLPRGGCFSFGWCDKCCESLTWKLRNLLVLLPSNCSISKYSYLEIIDFQVTMLWNGTICNLREQYPEIDQKAKVLG